MPLGHSLGGVELRDLNRKVLGVHHEPKKESEVDQNSALADAWDADYDATLPRHFREIPGCDECFKFGPRACSETVK